VPILAAPLEKVKAAVDKALPRHKQKSALEEAEFEDEIGDDLQKHMMVQCELTVMAYSPQTDIKPSTPCGHIDLVSWFTARMAWARDISVPRYCTTSRASMYRLLTLGQSSVTRQG